MTQEGDALDEVRQMCLRGLGHHHPGVVAHNVAWADDGLADAALVAAVVSFLPAGPVAR